MKWLDDKSHYVINLPKSHYRLLNPPAPPRLVVLATAALIVITALLWAIL